jgi:hypothetical protein
MKPQKQIFYFLFFKCGQPESLKWTTRLTSADYAYFLSRFGISTRQFLPVELKTSFLAMTGEKSKEKIQNKTLSSKRVPMCLF